MFQLSWLNDKNGLMDKKAYTHTHTQNTPSNLSY